MNNYFKYKKVIKCKDTGEVCVGYKRYLESNHWINLRKSVINSRTVCAVCGENNGILQLHHLTYERLGQEHTSDLLVLCEKCHLMVHENVLKNIPKNILSKDTNKSTQKKQRVCERCRSFSIIKYCGTKRPYCQYHSKPIERKDRACNKFSTKRKVRWCNKKPF